MMSTENSLPCHDGFIGKMDHEEIDDEEPIGKGKECSPEGHRQGEKSHPKDKLYNAGMYLIDGEDGVKIESLMADVEISLTTTNEGPRACPPRQASLRVNLPPAEVKKQRQEKRVSTRARKERKRLSEQQMGICRFPVRKPVGKSARFPVLLVLDLDGTLVHSEFQRRTYQQHDFSLFNEEIFVYKRPYLDYFVSTILEWFEVAVWTASGCEYAAEIVRHVFPDPSKVSFLFSAERCTNKLCPVTGERIVIKDMKKVKRRGHDLNRVLIVDDTPSTWQRNYGNAIHIESYWGSRVDDHLLHLLTYLEYLGHESNVRQVDKRRWRNQVLGSMLAHNAVPRLVAAEDDSDSD